MKNYFNLILILLLSVNFVWAQCPSGDLEFTTQQQIDDFATQYPNCTELPGSIMASGSDIFDLRAFSNITTMGGLLILNCTNLTHATGFENLSLLNGSLIMTHNPSLIDVFGLSNLENVYGNFVITDNPMLKNCSLDFICHRINSSNSIGSTQINNNGFSCTSIDELTYPCLHTQTFPSCYGTFVQDLVFTSQTQLNQFQGGCRVLIGSVTIDGNDITDIGILSRMSGIEGELIIKNTALTDLLDFSSLNFMTLTNLVIENNPLLTMCGMGNICRYLQEGGTATINNNGTGCSSLADLAAICGELGNCPLNYAIFTQADADNFAMLYPNCSILSGTMRVGHEYIQSSDINDLSALSTLTQVYGDLIIQGSSAVTDLDYLQNVTTVIGDMYVRYNNNLQNIAGLQSLTSVGRDLRISYCDMITDLTGLENLTTIGRDVGIYYNDALLNIDALQNLSTISGRLSIQNESLQNLNGLQNITTIGGFSLTDNDALANLNGLQNLIHVDGDFAIWKNDGLTDLTALQNLTNVSGQLQIRENDNLPSLTGLENLTDIEELTIASNGNLSDISSLMNITSTITGLSIFNNSILNECTLAFVCEYLEETGLGQYEYINNNGIGCESEDTVLENCLEVPSECPAADITLSTQQQINDFAATYPNCTQIAGLLQIGQPSGGLTDITDLSPLSSITVAQSLSIERTQLTGLSGLEALQVIVENLKIILNPNLNTIIGFGGNTHLTGQLHIAYNKELTDLEGLNSLRTTGSLRINNNNKLSTLSALSNLETAPQIIIQNHPILPSLDGLEDLNAFEITDLTITSNPLLATCHITSICNYFMLNNGSAFINNNAMGCNSSAEIEAACTPTSQCPPGYISLDNQQQVNDFAVLYPNCTEIQEGLAIGNIFGPNNISDLSPLSQIVSITGGLTIGYTQLTDLSGLEQLQEINELYLELNTQLTNINALTGITSLRDGIYIGYNRELINLEGLNQVTSMGRAFIRNNIKLESLQALSNWTSIDENSENPHTLAVQNNDILTSLEGIDNVDLTMISLLLINSNPQLTTCGYDNICNYIENPNSYTISNNGIGCTDAPEIQQNCNTTFQCPTGDVTLTTQQQVNDFATTYPNCTEIEGTLHIGKTSGSLSNITDLSPLNQIQSVGGISIQRTQITDLSGLEQLQTVNGDLRIVLNPNLLNINALNGVTSADGQVHIGYNKELVALTGLNQLNSVGSLRINNNNKLANLSALMNLQTAPEIIIQNNQILASLAGLEGLNPAQLNNATITSNPLLSDCAVDAVCQHLTNQGANFIANNATGCATASQVEDACMSSSTCMLGDIFLLNQQQVNDFAASYANCPIIDGNIFIGQTSGGLNDITDLSPLGFITEIQTIEIRRTQATDLSGLEQLQSAENIKIELNPSLTNINALSNLNAVSGELHIGFNKELLTLDGLEGLNSVGILYLKENKKLMSLAALSNLTQVMELRLNRNLVLTTLAGLENIDPNAITYIELSLNEQLSECSINPICTHLIENPNLNYWIIANGEGCATTLEIVTNCVAPPDDDCEPVTETYTFTYDEDLCIDGVGFENNPNITFTDPGTPADAILQNAYFEVYLRLKEESCEEDFVIRVTTPDGNTTETFPSGFLSCTGDPSNLYHIVWSLPSSGTTGNMDDWLLEFDDSNDQNAGDEYSVRFARMTYTAITTEGTLITNEVSDFADFDLFIDGVGFANNDTYTFTDPGTPADATLSDISLELYFKLNGSSCENEIAVQITDPAGNTQPLTTFPTCIGGTDLYYINLDVPSGNTTGNIADWVVQFDDTNDQNADYEYSVRFGRLTYNTQYIDCMEMLVNENNNEQQLINSSIYQPVNPSTHQLVSTSIKLYPVPASQHLNVEYFSENANSTNIEVLSNEGKTLMQKDEFLQEGMNTIQLDIADLPVGYYFIRMYGAEDVQTQPFVKIAP